MSDAHVRAAWFAETERSCKVEEEYDRAKDNGSDGELFSSGNDGSSDAHLHHFEALMNFNLNLIAFHAMNAKGQDYCKVLDFYLVRWRSDIHSNGKILNSIIRAVI